MTRNTKPQPSPENALAIAIGRNDWDRAAILLVLAFARTLRELPVADIEDVIDLFEGEEDRDA